MSGDGARYRFGPRERGGALAGWRAGQILTVAVGLAVAVAVLRARPDALGAAGAVVILVACGVLATWPVNGRTGEQWLPVVYGGARGAPGGGGWGGWIPSVASGCSAWGQGRWASCTISGRGPSPPPSPCAARDSRCSVPTSRSGG